VQVPLGTTARALATYGADPAVEFAQPDYIVRRANPRCDGHPASP
jgi:hypothetical protein